jgi:hypothetical protein
MFMLTYYSPLHLETRFADYILGKPAQVYSQVFEDFYEVHRMAQLIIGNAQQDPGCTEESFVSTFQGLYDDFLDKVITSDMIQKAVRLYYT